MNRNRHEFKHLKDLELIRICRLAKKILDFEDWLADYLEAYQCELKDYIIDIHDDELEALICIEKSGMSCRYSEAPIKIRIVDLCTPREGRAYQDLTRRFSRKALSYLYPTLTQHEYALVVFEDCTAILLEGFEDRVYMPLPPIKTLFFAHTHPYSIATFSRRDIISLANMLSDQCIASCVIGLDGGLCIYRTRLLSEEDYIELLKLADEAPITRDKIYSIIGKFKTVSALYI